MVKNLKKIQPLKMVKRATRVAAAAAGLDALGTRPVFFKEPRYRGLRKTLWGRFTAEIRDSLKKVWLGTFDTAARTLSGLKAKTDLPLSLPLYHNDAVDPFSDHRFYVAAASSASSAGEGFQDHRRPTSSGMSSTVESFSGPRPACPPAPPLAAHRRYPRTPPVVPEDCRSECDSSASVDDDGDCDSVASSSPLLSSRLQPLPLDLNSPPLDDADEGSTEASMTFTSPFSASE